MVIIRSPHLTRRRAATEGVMLNRDGVPLPARAPPDPNEALLQQIFQPAQDPPLSHQNENRPVPPRQIFEEEEGEYSDSGDTMAEEELHDRLRNVNLNRAERQSNGPNIVEGLREDILQFANLGENRNRQEIFQPRTSTPVFAFLAPEQNQILEAQRNQNLQPNNATVGPMHYEQADNPQHLLYENIQERVVPDHFARGQQLVTTHQRAAINPTNGQQQFHAPRHTNLGPKNRPPPQFQNPTYAPQQHPVHNQAYGGYQQQMLAQPPVTQQYRGLPNMGQAQQMPNPPPILPPYWQQNQISGSQGFAPQQNVMNPQSMQLAPSNLEYHLVLEKIPDLSGSEGNDGVKRFFKKFDAYTEEWPDRKRLTALESKVFGRAERAFESAKATQPSQYALIKREMLSQLDETDAKQLNAFDTLMEGIKRGPSEGIDELANRISALVRRAYSGLTQHLCDEYAIKFLIRAMSNPELALNLELARTPGMSLDHFVSLAARAESTQKATRRFAQTARNFLPREQATPNQGNQSGSRPNLPTPHNVQQQYPNTVRCYNCDKPGHISRNCQQPKIFRPQYQRPATQNQFQNFTASGANRTPIRETSDQNNSSNYAQRQLQSKNYLKQNCLTVPEEDVSQVNVCLGKMELAPEIDEFFENIGDHLGATEGRKPAVGKIMAMKVEIVGTDAETMLDCGAQISLISPDFFVKLVKEKNLDLSEVQLTESCARILDVNGKPLECYASVSLPVQRKGILEPIMTTFHIAKAPIGFDLLVGTNALGELGFKLYDEPNQAFVNFEKVEPERKDFLTVIFRTTIEPRSSKILELNVDSAFEGSEILASSAESQNVRVQPSVGIVEKGRICIPVTNFSSSTVVLEEETQLGQVEKARGITEIDDFLHSPLIIANVIANNSEEQNGDAAQESGENREAKFGPLPNEDAEQLRNLLGKFDTIFAKHDRELTQTNLVEHAIETENAAPIRSKVRPVPYAYREKVAGMVQEYLGRGIIRPSHSPWASPIVIVPKKDGSLRFCVDYRGVNSVTRKDSFPLPNIDNTLLMLGGKKYFTTLDFMSGYWQIRMDENSVEKTAFVTNFGLHEFVVMPFGLSNAVATFQRFMSRLFEGIIDDFVFVYIDDILIASETFEKHFEHLKAVFSRIKEAGLKLKVSKCHFGAVELPFLGHFLTREGIKMDADKAMPVTKLPLPTTKKELQSLLGFFTYYRKFIYSFGTVAAPLYRLLRDGVKFCIGEKEKEAIDELKRKVLSDVVLYFPDFEAAQSDPSRQFIIMTDASKTGLAAVLCQPDPTNTIRPIYFASRQCSKFEAKYCPTELEALAIRFGVKKFAQFITMLPVRVITDHKALIWMFKSKNETGNARVDRWLLEMNARFILKVEYRPGKQNIIADVLSRSRALQGEELVETQDENDIAFIGSIKETTDQGKETELENRDEWIAETKISEMKPIYDFLEKRAMSNDPREQQRIMETCHKYAIVEKLLYLCDENGKLRLFVPAKFREELIRTRHEGKCAGHMSGKKLHLQISETYFWPNMLANCIQEHLKCRICAHTRNARAKEPPLNVVQSTEPLELVCMDILDVGPSLSNQKYICVIVDHFTKYVIAEPIPNKSAESVAKVFVEKFVLLFGAPKKIHSDRGREFLNSTMEEISKTLGIKRSFTAGYDPQANGLAERINRILIGMLKKSRSNTWTWDERLAYAVFSYNITPSSITGFSPFLLMFGRSARFPSDETVSFSVNPAYTIDQEGYIQLFRENLLNVLENAKQNSEVAREKSKNWYDSKPGVTANKFKIGDRAMVIFPGLHRRSAHKKLLWSHFGPYLIQEISNSSAKLVPSDKQKEEPITVPVERLIKVPKGIPDISTLPRGRNQYKNLLKEMTLCAAIQQNWEIGRKEETKIVRVMQLGTIASGCRGTEESDRKGGKDGRIVGPKIQTPISGGTEKVDVGFNWTSTCRNDLKGHELCSTISLEELDPVLSRTALGTAVVKTPLQALLGIFLLRSGVVQSMTAGRALVELIVGGDERMELLLYSGKRGDQISTGKQPSEEDMLKAMEKWAANCDVARQKLLESGYSPLRMNEPEGLSALPEAERKSWTPVFEKTDWVLERVRASVVHRAEKLVCHPRVFLGDSSALQLAACFDQAYCIGPKEGRVADIIRAFQPTVLSSEVKVLVVIAGRDSLMAGETAEAILEQFQVLVELCKRFGHVKVLWSCPPYVHVKKQEFEALVAGMRKMFDDQPAIVPICTTATGRSALEIFRFGDGFNQHLVKEDGEMKNAGARALKAWLMTQTPFPGDAEMKIRSIGSAIVVPAGNRADSRQVRSVNSAENRAAFPPTATSANFSRNRNRADSGTPGPITNNRRFARTDRFRPYTATPGRDEPHRHPRVFQSRRFR